MRSIDAKRSIALALALVVHVAAGLFGLHLVREGRQHATPDATALQVVWIERPRPVPPAPADPPTRPTYPFPSPAPPPATASESAAVASAPVDDASDASRSMSAVFIEQARAIASGQARHDFRGNPLTDGPRHGVEAAPERIRMRDPLSPARVVAAVGELFGGPGYGEGPCPRIRHNIAKLGTGGADQELLQEELRRQRQFCQQ